MSLWSEKPLIRLGLGIEVGNWSSKGPWGRAPGGTTITGVASVSFTTDEESVGGSVRDFFAVARVSFTTVEESAGGSVRDFLAATSVSFTTVEASVGGSVCCFLVNVKEPGRKRKYSIQFLSAGSDAHWYIPWPSASVSCASTGVGGFSPLLCLRSGFTCNPVTRSL